MTGKLRGDALAVEQPRAERAGDERVVGNGHQLAAHRLADLALEERALLLQRIAGERLAECADHPGGGAVVDDHRS
jgi:uncharacterized membrane protein